MRGARLLAVSLVRVRSRQVVALALLAGIVGGAVLASLAGARRTRDVFDRLLESSKAHDVQLSVVEEVPDGTLERIARLPHVAASGRAAVHPASAGAGTGRFEWNLSVASLADRSVGRDVDVPRVVAGRMPRADAPGEAAISAGFGRAHGVSIGDEVVFRTLTFEEMFALFAGERVEASLPPIRVRVVGMIRLPHDVSIEGQGGEEQGGLLYLTPAMHARLSGSAAQLDLMVVRLRPDASLDAFMEAARREAGAPNALDFRTQEEMRAAAQQALDVQAAALLLFAALAAVGGFAIVAQSFARLIHATAGDVNTLDALGMSRSARAAALLAAPFLAAVAGALVAGIASWAASGMFPFGFARAIEPDPGMRFDALALILGGLACCALPLILSVPAVLRASRARARLDAPGARPSAAAEALARAGGAPTLVTGARFALVPRAAGRTIPLRSALLGGVVGSLAVVCALTFASSFSRALDDPRSYGWTWDGDTAGFDDDELVAEAQRSIAERTDLAAVARLDIASVGTPAGETGIFAFTPVRGAIAPLIVEGRAPVSPREVALGARLAEVLDARVGGDVELEGRSEGCADAQSCRLRFEVVGRTILPPVDGNEPGWGIVIHPEARDVLARTGGFSGLIVRFAPGADRRSAIAELEERFGGFSVPYMPAQLSNLARVRALPLLLALLLGVVAAGAMLHALSTSVKARRRDLSILKVLGFERRQVRATVMAQGSIMAALAALLGLPAGASVGRWGWRLLADRLAIDAPAVFPAAAVVVMVVSVVALANVVAVFPARAAARTQPAHVLRAE